jgi:hypothetical protein
METTLFGRRLAETIAWCSLQVLDTHPRETDEFKDRKAKQRMGVSLLTRASLLEKRGTIRSWLIEHLKLGPSENPDELRREAKILLQQGDVSAIYPLNDQLRTKSIAPFSLKSPKTDRAATVEELCHRRAELLRDVGAYPEVEDFDLANGKLLRYEPDYNVSDGAAQDITQGYFDLNDTPPWDTWVCFIQPSLISYVPEPLVSLAQSGIDVNPVDCIGWIDKPLLSKLRGAYACSPGNKLEP